VGRTGGAVGAVARVVVEVIDARSSVLARQTLTFVRLRLAQSPGVPGLAVAPVLTGTVHACAVHARHAHAVVRVQLATAAVVT